MLPACIVGWNWEGIPISHRKTVMPMITPSAQFTLNKGNKSGSSPAGAAALELVDPLALDLGCHSLRPLFFFFFFFFFFPSYSPYICPYIYWGILACVQTPSHETKVVFVGCFEL
eukprot:FR741007.1.p2 GENE.FR741007.1~~FR741007.1.p2  ORF type:complete len:115 (-),score=27.96 FR741007.1:507-851(-)